MDTNQLIYAVIYLCVFTLIEGAILFDPKPQDQDADNDRNTLLTCGVTGPNADEYVISWLSDGAPIINDGRRFQLGNNLKFQPVDKDLDSGEFQCEVKRNNSDETEAVSDPVQLNIRWVSTGNVELKSPSSPSQILPGTPITLKCNIDGNPKPKNWTWYVDGEQVVVPKKSRRFNIVSGELDTYDGKYTCCATYEKKNVKQNLCTTQNQAYDLKVIDRRIPILIQAPVDQILARGSNVTLHCLYTAVPPPEIIWLREANGKELSNKTKMGQCTRRCIYSNGTMTLHNVRDNLAGRYSCKARQGGEDTTPVHVTISLARISKFVIPSIQKYVELHGNFEHNCQAPDANPPADIAWTRNGSIIGKGQSRVTTSVNTLVINNAASSDAGNYTCVAENLAGKSTMNLTLVLSVPPSFGTLLSQIGNEGSNVTWTCPVQGVPLPPITWYKDNSAMMNAPGKVIIDGVSMTILNVDANDQARYYCGTENNGEQSGRSKSAQLRIFEKLKFYPDLQDTCIESGQKRQIDCKVKGSIRPNINWIKLNGSQESTVDQSKSDTFQSLNFFNPTKSDSGLYRCSASASTSSSVVINQTIRITVVKRPVIVAPPQNITVFAGRQVTLDCGTTPSEETKVEWRFKDEFYTQPKTQNMDTHLSVLSNGSLVIFRVQTDDQGIYRCIYTSCVFNATDFAELTVAEDSPENPYTNKPTDKGATTQMIQTIALSVSGGIAYILITVALIIYCRGKHKRKRKNKSLEEEEKMLNGSSCNGHARGNHDDEVVTMVNGIPMQNLSHLDDEVKNLMYPVSRIDPITIIGKGEFGDIFLSKAPGLFPDLEEDILVMVKVFQSEQNTEDTSNNDAPSLRSEFNREVNLLHRANHENIVKLLAVSCKYSELKPDHLITEYLEWGILKLCLGASKEKKIAKFTKHHKMNMCCQLACGLDHLNKLGLVHKDIATRNCVVSSQLLIKISMLGLSKEGFENEYHEVKGKRLPIRWMPSEALFEGHYSSKSDVWSFAVACWEIFMLGEFPFEDLTDEEYIEAFQSEEPPSLPPLESSKRITSLIRKCCHPSPSSRPDIKQIMKKLQSILGTGDAPNGKIKTEAIVTTETGDALTEDSEER